MRGILRAGEVFPFVWEIDVFRYVAILFILLLSSAESWSVQPYTPVHPDPVLESWRWQSSPELKGLGLQCMAEDSTGSMWFGVDDGVQVYDGLTWTPYTEADGILGAPVITLCATKDGSLYAGTHLGISRFRDGSWRRVFPPAGDLPWPVYDLMEASDGSVWAGTEWGALRLFGGEAGIYTTKEIGAALRVLAPYVSPSVVPDGAAPSRSWGEGSGIEVLVMRHFTLTKGLQVIRAMAPGGPGEASGLKVGDRITSVDGQPEVTGEQLNGPAGTSLTLMVERAGRADPFEVTVTREQVPGDIRDFPVWDVYEDREGAIWFGLSRGLEGGEIVRYDPRFKPGASSSAGPDTAWQLYTEKDGLDIGGGPRILQTRDGVIWTVSWNGVKGVNRFDREGRRRLNDSRDHSTLPKPGESSGVGAWSSFHLGDLGGTDANSTILETADGTLWVGGRGSLHAYRNRAENAISEERLGGHTQSPGQAWKVYQGPDVPIPRGYATGLLEASDGALWIAGLGQEAARLDYRTSRWTTYKNLIFQCETPDEAQWFLSEDDGVVRYNGKAWTRFGVEDGLMDTPRRLITTREGILWAAGSHDTTAATARFDASISPGTGGRRWSLNTHPEFSWGIFSTSVYESSEGALWFATHNLPPSTEWLGGLLRFHEKTWTHYTRPEAPYTTIYGIGQTADGSVWVGGTWGLIRFDGRVWMPITEPVEFTNSVINTVYATPKGRLWVGTRNYGAFHYDGQAWTRYDVRDGLADNNIVSILQTDDGSVWTVTEGGTSRFDGRTWTTQALPEGVGGFLAKSRDGALWINRVTESWAWRVYPGLSMPEGASSLRTIRYESDTDPPETAITLSLSEVSQPGNTTLAWRGTDPWHSTPDEELQYAYRLDGGEWSAFSLEKSHIFELLPSGNHTFEVKARDRDFNEDPAPAAMHFTVVPPVWQEPWFIGLMAVLLGGIGFQTVRVVRRDRRLQQTNAALSGANKDLFGLNRELQEKTEDLETSNKQLDRERAVERVRAEVTAMVEADDLKSVVDEMLKELVAAGVEFDLCVINIVDEEAGVCRKYSATKEGWSDQDETPLSEMSETFLSIYREGKPVVRQVDDALAEWHFEVQKRVGATDARPTAVVDAPFAYGTLSLNTHNPDGFGEEDVALVSEFARVIALGYTRYLNFKELETANKAMSKANKELFQANQALQRDSAVERIRGEVQAMEQASDFEHVLSLLSEDLKTVGLSFDTCGIDVLDEPVDKPTMAYFEDHGFQYTTYTIDPEGIVTRESYQVSAPFPPVNRETIERFIAGEPWKALIGGSHAILEVPASNYGRLRITSSERQDYSDEDIESLQDFASAIALGYARYLDIREIQEQTQRKSRFLANMSHELRTPMNAIIGFTRMVLRRGSEQLSERHKENLEKVTQSADHLLGLINSILDLSKIEAGRMDVEVNRFSVEKLMAGCCATVGPLVKTGVNLTHEVAEEVTEAQTDEGRLRQIVINLLSNALKFTDRGQVAVRVSQDGGDEILISVSDTGTGIPEGSLGSIFEEFQQVEGTDTERKGTGLGLPITKGFAELLGGSISVQSKMDQGSTFTVRVPVVYKEG